MVCSVFVVLVLGFGDCCYEKLFLLDSRMCLESVFPLWIAKNVISFLMDFFKVCNKFCSCYSAAQSFDINSAYFHSVCVSNLCLLWLWLWVSKKHSDCWNTGMQISFSVKILWNHIRSTHKIWNCLCSIDQAQIHFCKAKIKVKEKRYVTVAFKIFLNNIKY